MRTIASAVRSLARVKGFSALVVLTLALGIGSTTAMFSVVDAVLLNPLPFPNANRLIEVWINYEEGATRRPAIMNQVVSAVRDRRELFDAVSGYAFESGTLTGAGEPVQLSLASLSPSSFALLPTAPLAGRLFVEGDAAASSERVLLISERFWTSRFGRDPNVVGRIVTINDQPNRIIGVLPSRFVYPDSDRDGWRPIDVDTNERQRLMIVALRKAEISRQLIDDRLKAVTQALRESGALPPGQFLATAEPLSFTGGGSPSSLYLLLTAAGVLLLVACVNVTNLLLVRGSATRSELALRASLGAGRWQLMRDAAVESCLLAVIGGAAGLWLARVMLDSLLTLAPPQIQSASRYVGALDPRAVLFAVILSLLTCLAWSVLPAWYASRVSAMDALQRTWSTALHRDLRWQGTLLSTQIALVVVLLAGAGLLLRSYVALNTVDLGFDPERLVAVEFQLTQPRYAAAGAALQFVREIESRVEREMGVAATVGSTPIRTGGIPDAHPEAEGLAAQGETYLPFGRISPDFFDVYRIPIIEGRALTAADGNEAAVINDVFARRLFGGVSPIGRRFRVDRNQPWLTVVGVARDVKTQGPADARGGGVEMYLGYSTTPRQYNFLSLSVVAGTDPRQALDRIKKIVWALDPRMPILSAAPLAEQVADSISRPRFVLSLSGAFTVCALLIAAVGVYGVSAFWVASRRRELAIRMAIGASPKRLIGAVLSRSLLHVATGAVAGLLIAVGGARALQPLLFAIDARDPATLVTVIIVLGAIALLATAAPAIRASRVDPMTTLRAE